MREAAGPATSGGTVRGSPAQICSLFDMPMWQEATCQCDMAGDFDMVHQSFSIDRKCLAA